MLELHQLQLLVSRLDPAKCCLVQRQVTALPGVQKIQPVLHQRGVKALLPQLHLLELVSAWNGERRRSKGSLATHNSTSTIPVLPQTQPCIPMPQNHLRNWPWPLWGREAPSLPYRLISITRFPPPRLPQLHVQCECACHSSLVLETSCRNRRNTGCAYSGRAFFSLLENSSRSQEFSGSAMAAIPALPSIPKRQRRKSTQTYCPCSIISPLPHTSKTLLCTEALARPAVSPLCHHPVARATSDTLRSQSWPEGTQGPYKPARIRPKLERVRKPSGFLLATSLVASSQLTHRVSTLL